MTSKSSRPAIASGSNDDLSMPITIQHHQIQAARKPEAGIRSIITEPEFAGRPIRIWSQEPTLAKLLNDALRPRGDEALA